jgi:hypothetical protein
LTFRHTFGALLIGPLGALTVVACLLAFDNDDLGLFASFVLLGYFLEGMRRFALPDDREFSTDDLLRDSGLIVLPHLPTKTRTLDE